MPGTTNHERQYTSTYYAPFRFYSEGVTTDLDSVPIIDFSTSESANNNEILILPYDKTSVTGTDTLTYNPTDPRSTTTVSVYALVSLGALSGTDIVVSDVWVNVANLDITDGTIASVAPLYATKYKLLSSNADFTLNVSNNAVYANGGFAYNITQTYPVEKWQDKVAQPIRTNYNQNTQVITSADFK